MSNNQLWQAKLNTTGTELVAFNSMPTPNKVVVENIGDRWTVFLAAGPAAGTEASDADCVSGGAGAANNIVLRPGARTPVITLASGAVLWAVSDGAGVIQVVQE